MADKKIIAVVGATGAQGGGLVAGDPRRSERRLRGARADAQARSPTRREGAGARGAPRWSPRHRRRRESVKKAFRGRARRVLRHVLLGALLAGPGDGAGARRWPRRRSTAGVKHVIWSTLEDTRKWVPLSDDRMPTLHGQVQGAALRLPRARRTTSSPTPALPTTFLLTSFYWDNFICFGMGPKKGPDGRLALTLPDGGTRSFPGSPPRTSARCAYGIFRKRPGVRRQDRRHRRAST